MTASRTDLRALSRAALLGLMATVALASVPALAQETTAPAGPLTLDPTVLSPAPSEAAPAADDTPAATQPTEPPVQVDNLEGIDPDTAGVLSEEEGGLGLDLWRGTPRPLVETLLPKLPADTGSAAMRDLMRRLLLSIAAVPEGEGNPGTLIAERVRLLADMGDFVGVNNLLKATPGHQTNKTLARIEVDARFLANDNARACALAASQIVEQDQVYWQKAFIFCQALAGEQEKAELGISLLREVGEDDPVFFSIISALGAANPPLIEGLADPAPLHLAAARAAKVRLPEDVALSNRPGVLRTVAVSPNAPIEIRLEAAERAEAAGALPVDTLRQLYTSVEFSKEDLDSPLTRAGAYEGAMSRALLYRTALMQTVPTAQAETMRRALELAREVGRYASTVRAFLPVLQRIPPTTELAWFAPEALRALLVAGDHDTARAWYELLRASAASGADRARALALLMPLAHIARFDAAADWSVADLPDWWGMVRDEPGAVRQARLLFTLMDVFSGPLDGAVWTPLILKTDAGGPVALPPLEMMQTLDTASRNARIGETVLLALLALGEDGAAGAAPERLGPVLRALWYIGFDTDARALALEAMIAAGF